MMMPMVGYDDAYGAGFRDGVKEGRGKLLRRAKRHSSAEVYRELRRISLDLSDS